MQFVGQVFNSVSEFYRDTNPSTLTGAIDIIVVEDEAGELTCSPFHVRFGKLQVFRPHEKIVSISLEPTRMADVRCREQGGYFSEWKAN